MFYFVLFLVCLLGGLFFNCQDYDLAVFLQYVYKVM